MTDLPAVNVTAVPGTEPIAGVQIWETAPDPLTIHRIWDHELDDLTGFSRPITLALASTLAGAWIGLLPSLIAVVRTVHAARPIDLSGLAVALVWGACFFGCGLAGHFAVQGQREMRQLKERIRSRNAIQLNPRPSGGGGSPGPSSPSA